MPPKKSKRRIPALNIFVLPTVQPKAKLRYSSSLYEKEVDSTDFPLFAPNSWPPCSSAPPMGSHSIRSRSLS